MSIYRRNSDGDEVITINTDNSKSLDLCIKRWEYIGDINSKAILLFAFYPNILDGEFCLIEYDTNTGQTKYIVLNGEPQSIVISQYKLFNVYVVSSVLTTKHDIDIVSFKTMFTGKLEGLRIMENSFELENK